MDTEQTVAELEDDPPLDDLSFVRIGLFSNAVDANLTKNKLQDAGIPTRVDNQNLHATLGPIYGAAYGGLSVLVPREEAASARAILGEVESARRERTESESPSCPYCQKRPSDRVLSIYGWVALALLTLGIFSIGFLGSIASRGLIVVAAFLFLAPGKPTWRCRSCRRRFNAPQTPIA